MSPGCNAAPAASQTAKASGKNKAKSREKSAWIFGQSKDRGAPIWKKGIEGASLDKGRRAKKRNQKDAAGAEKKGEKERIMNFSARNEYGEWRVTPDQKDINPDERIARDRRRVLRAFADVKPAPDLSVSIGPELILKDENRASERANAKQPDSELGLGMEFIFDF